MELTFETNLDYFWALLPEIVLSLWAMGVLLVDVFQKGSRSIPSRPLIGWLTLIGLGLAAIANGWLASVTLAEGARGLVAVDDFRVFANFILLLAGSLATLLSFGYLDRHGMNRGEFHVLLMFAVVGMMILAGAQDLILLFVGLELMSISVYVLVAFDRRDPRSAEAGMKYFLLGAFASAFLLYGIALLFGALGTTSLPVVAGALAGGFGDAGMLLPIGVGLLAIGFAFKVAAVPFHVWTPDAYDGAPTPVTALMATGVKAAAFAAFIRVFAVALGGVHDVWVIVFWWLAALTMLGANLVALTQGSVKRMLAYSSVAHAGYLLVALVAANGPGISAFLFYLLVYTLMTAGAFGIVIANASGDRQRVSLDDYAGLASQRPYLSAAFALLLLSLAGFPLTAGFIGKIFILQASIQANQLVLAIILVMASLISYFYYLRVVVVMYMRPAPEPAVAHAPMSRPVGVAITMAAVAVLGLFFAAGPVLEVAAASGAALLTAGEVFTTILP